MQELQALGFPAVCVGRFDNNESVCLYVCVGVSVCVCVCVCVCVWVLVRIMDVCVYG